MRGRWWIVLVVSVWMVLGWPVAAMMVVCDPAKCTIGAEFFPRRVDLPNKLIVAPGQTVELAAASQFDYIEVSGTLRASRTHDTALRVTHLAVLPGGVLDIGTQTDPIPCTIHVTIVLRDVPIDTTIDPFQWGNGLVNFGKQTRVGCTKTAFVEASGNVSAGSTSLTLATTPIGWAVGDELLIPDTAQTGRTPADGPPELGPKPRRERPVTITAITGPQLTLSKPLDFAHLSVSDPQGVVVLRPRVANLSRNILIQSEAQGLAGAHGHTANIGHGSTWDLRYNRLVGLGRTLNIPLDDTIAGTHIGTNQRGKYADHDHHAESSPTSTRVGNVYQGLGAQSTKWAVAIHDTSDTLIERNISVDFAGAGFVTEDGNEVRNVFRANFATYTTGQETGSISAADLVKMNCPGCGGDGYWFRGVKDTFDSNEAWNNFAAGMNMFNQQQPEGILYPSVPGGPPDTAPKLTDVPILWRGNIVAVNLLRGLEAWATTRYPVENLIAAYNSYFQAQYDTSTNIELYFVKPTIVCAPGKGAHGIHSSSAYVLNFELDGGTGGYIGGCVTGVEAGGSSNGMKIGGNLILQNETNIAQWDATLKYAQGSGVLHQPLLTFPHRYLEFTPAIPIWPGGSTPLPSGRIGAMWVDQHGTQITATNWQGTGVDYSLFYRSSLGTNAAWYSAPGDHVWNTPVTGLTMQQSWDQYGIVYGGGVIAPSQVVPLDGIIDGLAKVGLPTLPTCAPKAWLTFPTLREQAVIDPIYGVIWLYGQRTCNPTTASRTVMLQIDGSTAWATSDENMDAWRTNSSPAGAAALTPGTHTVKVWRTQKNNPTVALPGSDTTAQYCLGPSCGGTPPPLTCQDPLATNFGGPLPCVYPPPPPVWTPGTVFSMPTPTGVQFELCPGTDPKAVTCQLK